MTQIPDDRLLESIESRAVELARGAGEILSRYFGSSLSVEFKDDRGRDPVTNADTEAQDFLERGIRETFPDHGILGEEDDESKAAEDEAAPDFLWVLDPLDGTKNFLHGLPVYASSVGVMYRGEPVVGAVFTPWSGSAEGVVHHARRGGGAYTDGEPINVLALDSPGADQLITVPGAFDRLYRFGKPVRGNSGDPRVTGSIAYELVLVSRGCHAVHVHVQPPPVGHSRRRGGRDGGRRSSDGRSAQLRPDGPVPFDSVAQVERPRGRVASGQRHTPRPQTLGQATNPRKPTSCRHRIPKHDLETRSRPPPPLLVATPKAQA